MTLVVDLRRAFDSGLGTYIREVVPRVLGQLQGVRLQGIVAAGSADQHRSYLGPVQIELAGCNARPLSVAEQWSLRRLVPDDARFWATTLSHPLFARRPLVATVHDVLQLALAHPAGTSGLARLASRIVFRSLRQRAGLLLFNSAFTRSEFLRCVGRSAARQVVTPLGVDVARWGPPLSHQSPVPPALPLPGLPAGCPEPYVLYVGNLRPHKNLALLIEAFTSVAGELPHRLLLAGRTAGFRRDDKALLARIQGLGPQVLHLGELAPDALRDCVRRAAALVIPSLYEGFGLPVLEAMAGGCPVIASNAASLPEAGGTAAMYFDPHDAGDLQRCLLRMAAMTADERAAWVQRGMAQARSQSWDTTAELTLAALHAGGLLRMGGR